MFALRFLQLVTADKLARPSRCALNKLPTSEQFVFIGFS